MIWNVNNRLSSISVQYFINIYRFETWSHSLDGEIYIYIYPAIYYTNLK